MAALADGLSLPTQHNNNKGAISTSTESTGRRAFLKKGAAAGAVVLGSLYTNENNVAVAAEKIPVTGAKAPAFQLPNSRGNGLTSLDDLVSKGKWTVLYF